ncbi:MAG TPA: sialidase family protein [Ktedonobacterales bacterium]|nr:sialidase family protein [Ktedonobacterales bacterium]
MSDLRPDDTYNANHSSDADERASLPPDLLPIHDRLSGDGARWRWRAPNGADLGDWTRATLFAASDDDTANDARGRLRLSERRLELDTQRLPIHGPKGPIHDMTMTRIRGFIGAAAAILVVGLIALLLTHAANRGGTGVGSGATPTPLPPTPSGPTSQQPGQFKQPDQLPVVAPGDHQVVYKIANGALLRSSDGGKTWASEALPKTDLTSVASMSLAVSPLDASHIFVTMGGQNNNQPCMPPNSPYPTIAMHGGVLASGYVPCAEQYVSIDGGHTWTKPTLPAKGVLGGLNMMRTVQGPYGDQSYAIQAQGSRLYAALAFDDMSGSLIDSPAVRLIASDDGGQTWRFVDAGLATTNRYICDFGAAPTSSVVYAVTGDGACNNESVPTLSLWRSGNGGQSWTHVRTLPIPTENPGFTNPPKAAESGLVVGPNGELYMYLPTVEAQSHSISTQTSPSDVMVSLDGGATFTSAPTTGLPGKPWITGPFAILADGSVIFGVSAPSGQNAAQGASVGVLYTWKHGASSWTKISGSFPAGIAAVTISPADTASTSQVVSIIDDSGDISTLKVALGQ